MGLKIDRAIYTFDVNIDIVGEKAGTFTTQDINHYTVYRLPFIKPCPVVKMDLDMDYQFYVDLLGKQGRNEKIKTEVKIQRGDEAKKDGSNQRRSQPKELVSVNQYYIMGVETIKAPSKSLEMARVRILMIDTLFHDLWRFNGLNKSVRNVTALDMIDMYDGYLISEFGSSSFNSPIHIVETPSSYIYRRHQLKATNDLILPTNVLMNKKPIDGLGYYFIDSFKFDISSEKRLTPLFIELTNKDSFQQYDCTQNGHEDIAIGDGISVKTISDSEDRFDRKGDYAKVYRDWRGRYKQYNPTLSCPVEQYISTKSTGVKQESGGNGRGGPIEPYSGIAASQLQTSKIHKDGYALYAPDHLSKCESRFNVLKSFFRDSMQSFVVHEFTQLHPESMYFNRRYNLDIYSPGEFKYIPVGIVNEFRKLQWSGADYKHTGYINFLKYN